MEVDDKWESPPHAQIPDLLGKKLLKRIKKVLKDQTRTKLLSSAEAEKLKHTAISCTSQLAEMLELARSIRVKADYFPNEKCRRLGAVVMLGDVKDGVAADWPKTASRLIGSLRKVCEKIGLII